MPDAVSLRCACRGISVVLSVLFAYSTGEYRRLTLSCFAKQCGMCTEKQRCGRVAVCVLRTWPMWNGTNVAPVFVPQLAPTRMQMRSYKRPKVPTILGQTSELWGLQEGPVAPLHRRSEQAGSSDKIDAATCFPSTGFFASRQILCFHLAVRERLGA